MRWSPLARKECRAVATSKGVWLLATLLVLWGYRPSDVGWDALGANITAGYVQVAGTALLPLGVLLLRLPVGRRRADLWESQVRPRAPADADGRPRG
jgi:hypothetical protein